MEKEPVKVNLSTVIIIILVILLIATGVFAGMLYSQNMKTINPTENNVSNVQETVKTVSESEAKEILTNYLNLSGRYQGSPSSAVRLLGEMTKKDVIDDVPNVVAYNGGSLEQTKIKYEEFKKLMMNYMTEELFNSEFSNGYINKDGDLYCKNIGASGVRYEVLSVEKEVGSDTKFKAPVITIFDETSKDDGTFKFELKEVNNKFVMSDITYPGEIQPEKDDNEDNTSASNNVNTNNDTNTNTNTNTNNNNSTKTETKSSSNETSKTNTKSTDKYKEIVKKIDLKGEDKFVVTDVEKSNGKYILKGRVYTEYKLTKSEYNNAKNTGKITINGKKYSVKKDEEYGDSLEAKAKDDDITYHITDEYILMSETQVSTCYKATDDFRKITIDENTRCVYSNYNGSIGETEVIKDTTAKNFFKDFEKITSECRSESLANYNFEFKDGKCVKVTIKTNWI